MNNKGNQGKRNKAKHGLDKAKHGLDKRTESSRIKRALFTIAAVLIPLVLLALAEVALRAGGVMSQRQSLFLPVPQDERYVAVNPRFAGRYFAGFEPDVAPQPFLRDKPAGTQRYFVLGGSSAAGFPYHFYHGFPAYLEEMLQMAHPGERVEVINLAMTAVNSFTLWDIHRELLPYGPDGILVYAGHNEYYGAMGAAAVSGWMRPLAVRRSVLRLQRLHLAAMVTGFAERLTGRSTPDDRTAPGGRATPDDRTAPGGRATPDDRTAPGGRATPDDRTAPANRTSRDMPDGRTLMARMAEDRLVHREDARFRDGIRHFEKNVTDITETFRKRGIPVYVSTVVSNKIGQEPLSGHNRAMDFFRRAAAANDAPAKDAATRTGTDTDTDAEADANARALYLLAKEEDPLRFRAPQAINDAIRRLSQRQGVTLVDAHTIRTENGVPLPYAPGHFTDHLHLDYRGYGLLATAFRDAMTADYHSVLIAPPDPLENLLVAHTIAVLKSDFPFERDPDRQRPAAVHRERLGQYRASGDPVPSALHDHFAGTRPLAPALAGLATHFRTQGQHREALLTLRALRYRQPLNPDLDALIMDYLSELAQQGVDVPRAAVLPLWTRLVAPAVDHQLWPHVVELLIETERFDDALRWLQVWEQHDPPSDFYRLYAMWHIRQDNHREAQPWFREYYRRIR